MMADKRRDYLLDSHVLLWSLYEPFKLPPHHRDILSGPDRTWVSVATIWEVEIKKRAGKLPIPDSIWDQVVSVGHQFLPIERSHAALAGSMPTHHNDPFDHMLIAQADIEGFTILTVDAAFRRYDVAAV